MALPIVIMYYTLYRYIVQQNTLVDLNDELVELELKLDEIMERIHVKASYHAQCVNDIAS